MIRCGYSFNKKKKHLHELLMLQDTQIFHVLSQYHCNYKFNKFNENNIYQIAPLTRLLINGTTCMGNWRQKV
jgi:hypothetical protein